MNHRNNIAAFLVGLFLLMFVPGAAEAATYYVATNGNDGNPGTEAAPFRTIAKGSQALSSGDTLLIRAGTYAEAMRHGSKGFRYTKGRPGALTRYAAYPGEQVIIKPADDLLHVVHFSDSDDAYVEISGLTIDGADLKGSSVSSTTLSGDTYERILKGYGIKGVRSSRIIGNVIRNLGMGMSGGPNTHIIGNEIYNMTSYGIYSGDGDGGLFACNRVHDTGGFAIHHYISAKTGKRTNNWTIRNNVIYRAGRGYKHSSSGDKIRTSAAVIISSGQGHKFYNNVIYDSNGGISVNYGGVNSLIANNTVYGNDKYGIIIGSGGARVINNISYGNGGSQIQDNSTGTVQQGNVTANPNFVNAAGADFHLNAGSIAIDGGVSLSEVATDKDGGTRGPVWDVGAYEHGATADLVKACDGSDIPPDSGGGGIDVVPPAVARPPSTYDPDGRLCPL